MQTRDWIELIGVIIGGTGGIYGTSLILIKIGRVTSEIDKIKELEKKVDALQSQVDKIVGILLFKGMAGAAMAGLGEINSPFNSSEDAKKLLDPLYKDMKIFVDTLSNKTISNVAIEIGFKFGNQIVQLCLLNPNKYDFDFYLVIAAHMLCEDKDTLK